MPDPEKIVAVRQLLPATAAGIYLNAGSCGPMPSETQRAMDDAAAQELAVGRAHPDQWAEALVRMEEARSAVAATLVADPADIALTHSTTDGMNLVISSLPWAPGDRVVTTGHEHPGGLGPLWALRDRLGVEIETVDVGDGGDPDGVVAAFERALARPARALMVSHVLWTTGAVMPVARLGDVARSAGAVCVIDGAQSAGAIPVLLDDLGVDAYAIPAQKWLLGPEGMGALWVRRGLADALTPAAAGSLAYAQTPATASRSLADAGTAEGRLHPGARRFEATGFHRPSVTGFARSLGWLSMYVGLPWAHARAGALAAAAHDRLAAIPGVRMVTPRAAMGTLVSFRIDGWPAAAAVPELGARAFAIIRDVPSIDAVRISVGFWNTDAELDRFAEVVELLARHAPGSIPPRRTLAMLGDDDGALR
jgi:L-cysteine/cystine lyase